MAADFLHVPPKVVILSETTTPQEQLPLPVTSQEMLRADQVQAVETLFSQDCPDQEDRWVAGLLGIWTGAMLLHDMTVEHLPRPVEEAFPVPPDEDKDED